MKPEESGIFWKAMVSRERRLFKENMLCAYMCDIWFKHFMQTCQTLVAGALRYDSVLKANRLARRMSYMQLVLK